MSKFLEKFDEVLAGKTGGVWHGSGGDKSHYVGLIRGADADFIAFMANNAEMILDALRAAERLRNYHAYDCNLFEGSDWERFQYALNKLDEATK